MCKKCFSIDAGIVGDYKNTPIIVRNSSSGVVTGILKSNTSYISNLEQETFNFSSSIHVRLVTTWASRCVFAEAVSGESQVLPSLAKR